MADVTVRIPIEITVRVGEPAVVTAAATVPAQAEERFILDNDYERRPGYDDAFLGRTAKVALPTLTDDAMKLVSVVDDVEGPDAHVLRYHHFSIVMNKRRRMAFFAAYNTTRNPDLFGTKSREELGASDKWILDPRIPGVHQVTTKELYKPTDFDRGHIVRREDAYWGLDPREAEYANFDTFHYTNCSPQHPAYNQSGKRGIWGMLENHIAAEATDKEMKLSIFAGPVLALGDPRINEVKIPRVYWKVVVARRRGADGPIGAWAFLLSQAALVKAEKKRFEGEEAIFDPGDFATYQVPVARIEELTDVRFDAVVKQGDALAAGDDEAVAEKATLIDAVDRIAL